MEFSCSVSSFFDLDTEAVVLFCEKGEQPTGDIMGKIDLLTDGTISEMYQSGEFVGSLGSEIMLRRVPEMAAGRVILAGVGKKDKITMDVYRRVAGRIGKLARRHKLKTVSFYYDGPETNPVSSAIVEGFALGSYRFLDYKTDEDAGKDEIELLSVVVPQKGKLRQAEAGLARGGIISDAVTHCRDLVGTPGNDLYPESFAKHAQTLAKTFNFDCKVLNPSEIKKENMGALIAVGKGSEKTPRFVILKYNGGKPNAKPVVLIGKGITFDAGGISLKPGLNMGEMKGDMTGAAVVLMTLVTAARLQAKVNLVALMPLAENMPAGNATRPGDIVTSRAGHTIEVINTDAEGRLILADALDYANTFDPQAVIDIATLTGAAVYILGYEGAPFIGTNQKLNDNLRAAADRTGERIWELPLWDEFCDLMKSPIADLKNSAGKTAGTLAAAGFLKKFTGDWPWAHIDIAYCDVEPKGRPYIPVGPTGIGVRLLVDLITNWKKV